MRKTKESNTNKGITLIALVITIIVMLILVAVTISMAINGGLFDYAGKAVEDTQNAINEEQLLAEGKVEVDGVWYDSIDDYIDGNVSEENTLLGMYKAGKLKVGDYVNYSPSSAEPYNPDDPEGTGTATVGALTGYTEEVQANALIPELVEQLETIEQDELTWRVLGSDGDNLLLISGTPTTTGGVAFYGHVGYNNYENVLNGACSHLYSNSEIGATARSINMNDIDNYLGGNAFKKENSFAHYGQTATLSNIYVPENWVGTNTEELTHTAFDYIASDVITDKIKLSLLIGENIPGTRGQSYYYWVASRSVEVYNGSAYWFLNCVFYSTVMAYTIPPICTSEGQENVFDQIGHGVGALCLRPVVSIPSNVTIEQVPILTITPTEEWDDPFAINNIPM